MSRLEGTQLLHAVAVRIIARYLRADGRVDVQVTEESGLAARADAGRHQLRDAGRRRRGIKVKADPYFGTDPAKIATDRSRSFYRVRCEGLRVRGRGQRATRDRDGCSHSEADDLYYYFLALGQTEDEVATLFARARRGVLLRR